MKRLLVATGIVSAGLICVFLLRPSEPKYRGKTISEWQDDWAAKKSREWPLALQEIGTNALPYTVQNLALNDSSWRSNYARLQVKLPGLLQKVFRKPKPLLQEVDGANTFFHLGSNSIPAAIALLKHDSRTVRRSAAWGLGAMRRQTSAANQAMPALIAALTDTDMQVRFKVALALKEMGPDASKAVPALTKVISDRGVGTETNNFFYLRAAAATALGKIGPSASNAIPALKAALLESNSNLRGQTAVAIWRISSDAELALPVLVREMPETSEHSKWDWIIALGEMGPRAKEAVPQLRKELKEDRESWVLNYVTNAFRNIDPEAAIEAGIK
jgi:HEAT repeat protein